MKSRRITVAFSCSPKPVGMQTVCLGLLMQPVWIYNYVAFGMSWNTLALASLGISVLAFIAGVLLWFVKRTAIERTVRLGGWTERLYLRGRRLFLAVTLGAGLAVYLVLSAVCSGIYVDEGMARGAAFVRYFISHLWELLVLFEIAVDRFTAFRQYYRSPVGTRWVVRRF